MTHLSVVIPVMNESLLIEELLKRVKSNVKIITEDYEIIMVDDGSQDQTWKIIEEEAGKEVRVKGIRFSRNFGHHYAITAGLHDSNGDWVIVMDGDLQDRPEVIPDLYNEAQLGFDVVFVSRLNRPEKLYYRIAQKIFYQILKIISGLDLDSKQANYSIISRKVVEAFRNFPESTRFYGATINWLGFKKGKVYADHGERFAGQPSYNLRKRFKLAFDIILSFSERPLKFAIGLGITVSTISLASTIWIVYESLSFGYSVIGWASTISIFLFVMGVILIVIGILGMYLDKIFNEVKKRPLFIKSETVNFKIVR